MINFVGMQRKAISVIVVTLLVSVVALITPGLNLGIDFTGGTLLERRVDQEVSVQEVRDVLANDVGDLGISGAVIQVLGRPNEFLIRTRTLENDEILRVDEALNAKFGGLVERRTEMVGPVIGQELIRQALLAMVIASIGILLYVSLRFEYRFAVAAIAASLHDVLIVLGVFALSGRELNTPFVAAILTVVGYSINDTIVIFDRIRENMRFRKKESIAEVVNTSLNQTLARTINTSLTTFFVVLLLFIFGGASIQDFAFALLVGILVGTYSSVFIASSVWLRWTTWSKKQRATASVSDGAKS